MSKRIDDNCPERYIKAFEAMREALRRYHGPCERTNGGHCPMLPIEPSSWCRACQLSAALAMAEEVKR